MKRHINLAILALLVVSSAHQILAAEEQEPETKDGKVLSLFTVVNFKNMGCRSTLARNGNAAMALNGTCYSSSECSERNGKAEGNCASGFGVCCVFLVSGTTGGVAKENCTYLRNPSYPAAYTATSQIVYTVQKVATDVCQLRLDFEQFQTLAVSDTIETGGGTCQDKLAITATSGFSVPETCGFMTGQHMYIHTGEGAADSATLTMTFSTTASTDRKWDIKVTQLFCHQASSAPEGCLQYFPTLTGRYTTFNFGAPVGNPQHLRNQNYQVCIRRAEGHCCVKHRPCADQSTASAGAIPGFAIDLIQSGADTASYAAEVDKQCSGDYLGIPGSSAFCGKGPYHSQYCGASFAGAKLAGTSAAPANVFSGACDCTLPFTAEIVTDAVSDLNSGGSNLAAISGLCIEFEQTTC